MCVDCVLASPRITQANPSWRIPPHGRSVTIGFRASLGKDTEVPKNQNYDLSVRIA